MNTYSLEEARLMSGIEGIDQQTLKFAEDPEPFSGDLFYWASSVKYRTASGIPIELWLSKGPLYYI